MHLSIYIGATEYIKRTSVAYLLLNNLESRLPLGRTGDAHCMPDLSLCQSEDMEVLTSLQVECAWGETNLCERGWTI